MAIEGLKPSALLLVVGVLLDAVFGDPQIAWHPIRLIGRSLTGYEKLLRRWGWNGYGGGCALFLLLSFTWVVVPSIVVSLVFAEAAIVGLIVHALIIYSLLALRDLIDHVRSVDRAVRSQDLGGARRAIGMLVGRDTDRMDLAGCRRAAIESLAENFVDGYLSALFWYVLLGLPGLLLFKVASTMDSMVGYKTPKYLRFGWCGARLDDIMNYLPARMAWLLLGFTSLFFPGLSARKAWAVGWRQHSILPGPNPGWSEATIAGAIQRRLIGPIWKDGQCVTEIWIGSPEDQPAGIDDQDLSRSIRLIVVSSLLALMSLCAFVSWW
jgi:adenosylcobinamide-phosphate synthase